MSLFIIFEDFYGMASIMSKCQRWSLGRVGIQSSCWECVEEHVFVKRGVTTSGFLKLTAVDIELLKLHGDIDRIVYVVDMDDISGDKSKCLQISDVDKAYKKLMHRINTQIERNVRVELLFAVYCAETIGILLTGVDIDVDLCRVVNKTNTTLLHKYLLAAALRRHSDDVKLYDWLPDTTKEIVLRYINQPDICGSNLRLLKFIACEDSIQGAGFTYEDAIHFLMEVLAIYEYACNEPDELKLRDKLVPIAELDKMSAFIRQQINTI